MKKPKIVKAVKKQKSPMKPTLLVQSIRSQRLALFRSHWKHTLVAFIAAGGIIAGLSTFAAGETAVATYEAESFTLPAGASAYADPAMSGGSAVLMPSVGAITKTVSAPAATRLEVRAKGDSCKGSPTMTVSVDGTPVITTSVGSSWTTYSATRDLTAGAHTFSVAFTNDRDFKNCSRSLRVDKLTLYNATVEPVQSPIASPSTSTITVNDATVGTGQNQFEYAGSWTSNRDTGAYNGDEHYASNAGDYYQLRFTGTQVKVYTTVDPRHGISAVSIDGGPETLVDNYAPNRANHTIVYTSPVLADAPHTLKVRITGTKNAASSYTYQVADRVEISGSASVSNPTPAISPTATAVASPGYSPTRPGTSAPLSDAEAASRVTRNGYEPMPNNATPNRRVPTSSELNAFYTSSGTGSLVPYRTKVTGNFTGTTDEIIQFAAWKWGIDEDMLRAVAMTESGWNQLWVGDNGYSYGINQIKRPTGEQYTGWQGTHPLSEVSTAFNADAYASVMRACYEGYWGHTGDLWGCIGSWYSGGWYDAGANNYINATKNHLANRSWLNL